MCATEIFAGTGWYFDIAPTLVFLKKTLVKLDRLQQLFAKQGWVRGRGGVARQSQVQAEVGRCRQGPPTIPRISSLGFYEAEMGKPQRI